MKHYNLCILGFGNVGQNLVRLLERKSVELRERYSITYTITGVATRRMGWLANPEGLDVHALLDGRPAPHLLPPPDNVRDWLAAANADVLFELTSLNPETGQPAIDHVRAALERGAHAITANKGTVVHAYHDLRALAALKGKRFLFEATVMDATPIFSLFRETLHAAQLLRFSGLLNSTTSVILAEIEKGYNLEEGIKRAQEMGITETDPSADIDGWDAAVKAVNIATVLMDKPIKLSDLHIEGIRGLEADRVRAARASGTPYKLVARAELKDGQVIASVSPEQVPISDPMGSASPGALVTHFELDTLPSLTLIQEDGGPDTTAYGTLCDFINAARSD